MYTNEPSFVRRNSLRMSYDNIVHIAAKIMLLNHTRVLVRRCKFTNRYYAEFNKQNKRFFLNIFSMVLNIINSNIILRILYLYLTRVENKDRSHKLQNRTIMPHVQRSIRCKPNTSWYLWSIHVV